MADYRRDLGRAAFLLAYACTQAADPLPVYLVIDGGNSAVTVPGHAPTRATRVAGAGWRDVGSWPRTWLGAVAARNAQDR